MPETVGLGAVAGVALPSIPGLGIPKLAAGRIVAAKAGWQSVGYTDAVFGGNVIFTRPPAALVLAESRGGWFTPQQFTAPKVSISLPVIDLPPAVHISVPPVTVPSVPTIPPFSLPSASVASIAIPSVMLPSVSITVPTVSIGTPVLSIDDIRNFVYGTYPFTADWLLLNWIKDALKEAVSQFLYWFWTKTGRPLIDKTIGGVQTALNSALSNTQSQVNSALAASKDRIQAAMNSMVSDANVRVAGLRDSVNSALKVITDGANQNLEKFRTNVNGAIGQIPASVQGALNTFKTNTEMGVNNAFKANRDKLAAALDGYRVNILNGVNAGFLQVTGFSTQALNSIVPMLWQTLGLPERQLFVPVLFHARIDGFDFHAPVAGTVIHYAAFGP